MTKSISIWFFVIAYISCFGIDSAFAHRKPPFQITQPNQYNEEESTLEGVEEPQPGEEAEEESAN